MFSFWISFLLVCKSTNIVAFPKLDGFEDEVAMKPNTDFFYTNKPSPDAELEDYSAFPNRSDHIIETDVYINTQITSDSVEGVKNDSTYQPFGNRSSEISHDYSSSEPISYSSVVDDSSTKTDEENPTSPTTSDSTGSDNSTGYYTTEVYATGVSTELLTSNFSTTFVSDVAEAAAITSVPADKSAEYASLSNSDSPQHDNTTDESISDAYSNDVSMEPFNTAQLILTSIGSDVSSTNPCQTEVLTDVHSPTSDSTNVDDRLTEYRTYASSTDDFTEFITEYSSDDGTSFSTRDPSFTPGQTDVLTDTSIEYSSTGVSKSYLTNATSTTEEPLSDTYTKAIIRENLKGDTWKTFDSMESDGTTEGFSTYPYPTAPFIITLYNSTSSPVFSNYSRV